MIKLLLIIIKISDWMKIFRRPNSAITKQQALHKSSLILQQSCPPQQPQPAPSEEPPVMIKTYPHSTPAKNYRINEQGVYNYVRNSICQTFKQKTTRDYDLVKQLTNITVPEQNVVIDRLCKKYSILRINKRSYFQNTDVNVEEITKRYVKSKSKEKQKQEEKARLKIDIQKNYRYGRNHEYAKSEEFFSFQGGDLRDLEKKHREKNRYKSFQKKSDHKSVSQQRNCHPYLKLYEQAQRQTLLNVAKCQKIELDSDFPTMFEPDEWQKNKDKIQRMVEENKPQRKRQIQSARARTSTSKAPKPDFFLT